MGDESVRMKRVAVDFDIMMAAEPLCSAMANQKMRPASLLSVAERRGAGARWLGPLHLSLIHI